MNRPQPPSAPYGWLVLWDEASQRYYYVEQSTGASHWELPPHASANLPQQQTQGSFSTMPSGESGSYLGASSPTNTSHPTQPTAVGADGERGLGKMLQGFPGGALAGGLLGIAAGKYLGNHHNHQHHLGHHQGSYAPPPPQHGFGGLISNIPFIGGNHHGNHHGGHHQHHGGHHQHHGGHHGGHHGFF